MVGVRGKDRFYAPLIGNSFVVKEDPDVVTAYAAVTPNTVHDCYGHVNLRRLQKLVRVNKVDLRRQPALRKELLSLKNLDCKSCVMGKLKWPKVPQVSAERVGKVLETVSSDISGPFPTSSSGQKYLITYVDHCSGFIHRDFLGDHSATSIVASVQNFVAFAEKQASETLVTLQTDNDRSYVNKLVSKFLSTLGVLHRFSSPYDPAQNGKVERQFRTIQEGVVTVLDQSLVPKHFWPYAADYMIYTMNHQPSVRHPSRSRVQVFFKTPPSRLPAHPFGCLAYAAVPVEHRTKLAPRASTCVFLGYAPMQH